MEKSKVFKLDKFQGQLITDAFVTSETSKSKFADYILFKESQERQLSEKLNELRTTVILDKTTLEGIVDRVKKSILPSDANSIDYVFDLRTFSFIKQGVSCEH